MRLFLAVKPDRQAEAQLAKRLLQVQDALGGLAASLRWTPAQNIHATLHFFGEVEATRLPQLGEHMGAVISEPPFDVTLGEIGAFPPAGAPRVVWLDMVGGGDALGRIHLELGRRLSAAGVAMASRPFSPHLTIARVPDRERARVKSLRERLASVPPMSIAWLADRVTLFRSDLTGAVPRYEPLQEIPLE